MYPIVFPVHGCGGKFGDNTELRYALRSIAGHFKDDCQVVIVGPKMPEWLRGARHLHGDGLKSSLVVAAAEYPDGFFWWYDDCCLLRDARADELKITTACGGWGSNKSTWTSMLEHIRQRLVAEGYPARDYSRPHGPYWFDKGMVDEGFADWPGMKAKFPWESWILSKRAWPHRSGVTKQYYGDFRSAPSGGARLLNYNDKGFTDELREWLGKRFPVACAWEEERAKIGQIGQIVAGSERKNALSFSLYGQDARYAVGMIENVRLAREIYPGWDVVVHAERGHYAIERLRRDGAPLCANSLSSHGSRGTTTAQTKTRRLILFISRFSGRYSLMILHIWLSKNVLKLVFQNT